MSETPGLRVGVLIVNYNRRAATLRAVGSVQRSGYRHVCTVVVENSEIADERLAEAGVEVLAQSTNRGFAGGCNIGISRLSALGADYYLLLNNDAMVLAGSIELLAASFGVHPAAGVIGPVILRPDGRIESAGISIGPATGLHRLLQHGRSTAETSEPFSSMAVPGTAMMISRRCFEATGGFDESLFCYFEDVDFCLRARRLGFDVLVQPAARVQHFKQDVTSEEIYYSCRNHLAVLDRHFPARSGPAAGLRRRLVSVYYRLYLLRRRKALVPAYRAALALAIADARAGRSGRFQGASVQAVSR